MPLYVYRCKCGETTQILHKWPPPKTCTCGHCNKTARLGVQMPARYRENPSLGMGDDGIIRPK